MAESKDSADVYFKPAAKVVLVDDSELNRDFIKMAFKAPNYDIYAASEGLEGIELINKIQPELILLDIMMPGLDGYDVAAVLKDDPRTANIPIIFITALNDIQDKLRAFEAGAVDFVTKPFNHRELLARVRTNIDNRRLMRQKDDMMQLAMQEKRSSAIARIAGGISHNINNMLCSAFGNIDLLKILQEDKLDDASSETLSEIQKSLRKIQLLSERFLVLSGHQYPDAAMEVVNDDFDLHKLVNDFIENNREQQTRAQVSYVNNVPEGMNARFDSSLLFEFMQLVVQETLDAALKYVNFTFSGNADGGRASFTLEIESDIVLPDDMEDSIFEPFAFPAANVGSGLSFSVARNLITRNGGEVSGSIPHPNKICFIVTFPAALS